MARRRGRDDARLQRLARELDDAEANRSGSASRSPARGGPASPAPSFGAARDEQDLGVHSLDGFVNARAPYAMSPGRGMENAPGIGLSATGRRVDAVAQELREERARRQVTKDADMMRRAQVINENEAASAAAAAAAAEVAAQRSGWEVREALRYVEGVEARQGPPAFGKPSGGFGRPLKGPGAGADMAHSQLQQMRQQLVAVQDAQEAGVDALLEVRTELEAAQRELSQRRKMDKSIDKDLKKLGRNCDPNDAALLLARREIDTAEAALHTAEEEVAEGRENASELGLTRRDLRRYHGEVSDMEVELNYLRGNVPADLADYAAAMRDLEHANRKIADLQQNDAEMDALRAGQEADARSFMQVNREHAEIQEAFKRVRHRNQTIADELEEMEEALGQACNILLQAERGSRAEMAMTMALRAAKQVNPMLLPATFLYWIHLVTLAKMGHSKEDVRAARLEAAEKSTVPREGKMQLSQAYHVRWFEQWTRRRLVQRMAYRAVIVLQIMIVSNFGMTLRLYFKLWQQGYHRHRKLLKIISRPKANLSADSPINRFFHIWLDATTRSRRLRSAGDAFSTGWRSKQDAWRANRMLQAWSRISCLQRAERQVSEIAAEAEAVHAQAVSQRHSHSGKTPGFTAHEGIMGLMVSAGAQQENFWRKAATWNAWARLIHEGGAAISSASIPNLAKIGLQLWLQGEVAESVEAFVPDIWRQWSRLVHEKRLETHKQHLEQSSADVAREGKNAALIQLERATNLQHKARVREVSFWSVSTIWQVWSFTNRLSRGGSQLLAGEHKMERLSDFIFYARRRVQETGLFLICWYVWGRDSLTTRAGRRAVDYVKLANDSAMSVLESYSVMSMSGASGEAGLRSIFAIFSSWKQESMQSKTHGVSSRREESVEKARHALAVMGMLHEEELSQWHLLTSWLSWRTVAGEAILSRQASGSKASAESRGREIAAVASMKALMASADEAALFLILIVWHAWLARVYKGRMVDVFGTTYVQIGTALSLHAKNWATPAWTRLLWKCWKETLPMEARMKEGVAKETRSATNAFAAQWAQQAEPKMSRQFLKTFVAAWLTVQHWNMQVRLMSFTASSLLEGMQVKELAMIKQFMFALWVTQRNTSPLNRLQPPPLKPPALGPNEASAMASLNSVANSPAAAELPRAMGGRSPGGRSPGGRSPGRASPLVDTVYATDLEYTHPRRLNPNQLFEVLEALMSVRARSWRLVCDVRSMSEGALLKTGELHEAMLALLEQAARHALQPLADASKVSSGALGPMADVLRLGGDAERADLALQERSRERKPLGAALLDSTAGAVRLVLDSKNASQEDARAIKMLAAELCELRADERKLADACAALAARIEDAGFELRSIADARVELPETPGVASGTGVQSELRTLDGAGESARRLLQTAASAVSSLKTDAINLLQYLDASELLRSVAVWGVEGAAADVAAGPMAEWPNKPARALVSPGFSPPMSPAAPAIAHSPPWAAPQLAPPTASFGAPLAPSPMQTIQATGAQQPAVLASQSAISWLEDEVLAASGPAGTPLAVRDDSKTGGLAALRSATSAQAGTQRSRQPDPRKLGEFQIQWRKPRLQTVWRAWLLFVQLVRRLRGAALDAELQSAIDNIAGPGRGVSGAGPHRGVRGQGPRGGARGPAAAGTVSSVENLLLRG